MINIFFQDTSRGPGKVVNNLVDGLNEIDIQYSKNPTIMKDKDYKLFLQNHNLLKSSMIENSIIGPNICTLPIDNKIVMEQKYKKILVPSEWVKNLYLKWIPEEKIEIWPVGVDTKRFLDYSNEEKDIDCLVYFKRRSEEDLKYVTNLLKELGHNFHVIKYGNYDENKFIKLMKKSKSAFVIDNCESQGLAIEEMMSCNLPLFVWDVKTWNDRGEENKVSATSVPYWSEVCGEKIIEKEEVKEKFKKFFENINSYNPRQYILDNLTLEKSASKILKLFENEEQVNIS